MKWLWLVFLIALLPAQASATTYSMNPLMGANQVPGSYNDLLQYGPTIMGLGIPSEGESGYLQLMQDSPVQVSEKIDLGLGTVQSPFYPVPQSISSADFDNDGLDDFAVIHYESSPSASDLFLTLYFSSDRPNLQMQLESTPPSGTCTETHSDSQFDTTGTVYATQNGPAIADINHDGLIDFTFSRGCVAYSFNEQGHMNPGWPLRSNDDVYNNVFHDLALEDIDGDGYTDVLLSSSTRLQAVRGNGTEIWRKDFGQYMFNAAIGNVDGGADREIVVSSDGIHVYRFSGTEKFSTPDNTTTRPFGPVRLSDIDGDHKLDLITNGGRLGNGTYPTLGVYRLNGSVTPMSGFPLTIYSGSFDRGVFTANLTKGSAGNDIIIPYDNGLNIISRTGGGIYTNGSGYGFTRMMFGTTDGTNFVAAGNSSHPGFSATNFVVDGQAVTMADQNDESILMRGLNARRTNSYQDIPLRQGAVISMYDLNADGTVNVLDLSLVLAHWGGSGAGDFDASGRVDVYDLSRFLVHFSH